MPQDLSVSGLRSAYLAGSLKPSDVISNLYSRLHLLDGIFVTLTPLEDAKSRCRCFEAFVLACTCKSSPSSPATFPCVRTDFQCHCMSSRVPPSRLHCRAFCMHSCLVSAQHVQHGAMEARHALLYMSAPNIKPTPDPNPYRNPSPSSVPSQNPIPSPCRTPNPNPTPSPNSSPTPNPTPLHNCKVQMSHMVMQGAGGHAFSRQGPTLGSALCS